MTEANKARAICYAIGAAFMGFVLLMMFVHPDPDFVFGRGLYGGVVCILVPRYLIKDATP